MVPHPWSKVSGMTIPYGHGMGVSPLSLITAVSAIVNGGILHPPTLFKRDPSQPVPTWGTGGGHRQLRARLPATGEDQAGIRS